MDLFNKNKPLSRWTIVLLIFFALSVILTVSIQYWARHKLIADPLSLSHEHDIHDASDILLKTALSGNASSPEAIQKLKALMLKLRDGWDGFIVDHYSPYKYTSQDVLGNYIYWEVARKVTQDGVANKEEILNLLHETRPAKTEPLWGGYEYALKNHGLESLLQKED